MQNHDVMTEAHNEDSPNPIEIQNRLTRLEVQFETVIPTLATKTDLVELRHDMTKDMYNLRQDIGKDMQDLRQDMQNMRQDINKDMQDLRQDINKDMQDLRQDISKDMQTQRQDISKDMQTLRHGIDKDIYDLRQGISKEISEICAGIHQRDASLSKWMLSTTLAIIGTIVFGFAGLIFNLSKTQAFHSHPPVAQSARDGHCN